MHLADDPVTLVLLGSLILLVGLPCIYFVLWRATRPPARMADFRLLCLAWACLLAASSVWNLDRSVRLSVEEAGADNFVRLAFLAVAVLIISFVGIKYRYGFFAELSSGPLGVFLLFAFWGSASTLWSVAPASTLYKSLEYGVMVVVFALTAFLINLPRRDSQYKMFALKRVFDFNWFLLVVLIVVVYVEIPIWPEIALSKGYREEMAMIPFSLEGAIPAQDANAVGLLAAIVGIVALVRILLAPASRILYIPIFVICLLTMVLTQSRAPILAFLVAAAVVLVANRRFGLLAMSGLFLCAVLLTRYFQLVYEYMRRGQDTQQVLSLTERVTWWQASVEAVRESWLGGYGANAGGRYILKYALGEEGVSTVHSQWIEVLVDTGVVGLILVSVGLLATSFWLFRLRSHAMGNPISRLLWFECLGVLTILSVISVFGVSFVWSSSVLIFGLVLVFINVARRQVVRGIYTSAPVAQPLPATRR